MSKVILLILLQVSLIANVYLYRQLSSKEALESSQSLSNLEKFRGKLKVATFYCSLHSSRDVIRLLEGRMTIWDKSSRSIQETVSLKPSNIGTYKILDSSLMLEFSTGEKHDLRISEVDNRGEITAFLGNTIYKSSYCQ
ncbi:hypothetical protein [Halobacteriovorax sp. HLS]|uniref:hypothetical protein n=1 Tax=Halobacteriovorax sp. HLS TaxID=2234000 RepID=UPI000FD7ED3E|nr:hypothetical protein [Halobacteriovorax sp. HLS]